MSHRKNETILAEFHHHATHVIINEPENLNVMFAAMVYRLRDIFRSIESDDKQRLAIFRSSGKVLSAGGNMKRVLAGIQGDMDEYEMMDYSSTVYYTVAHYMGNMKTPIVSIINGLAVGGGAMLAHCAPFRVATENAELLMPEGRVGTFPDGGAGYFLPRMDCNIGRYIALTGIPLKAEDLLFCGYATHFVKSENITSMNEELSKLENPTHDAIDKVIKKFSVPYDHQPSSYTLTTESLRIIESCFKYNDVIKIIEALEKDGSVFALKAKNFILRGSPSSSVVTLENFWRGTQLSFLECLKMDRYVSSIIQLQHDFSEGVETVLFKSKQKPTWKPNRLEDIDIEKDIRGLYYKEHLTNKRYDYAWNIHDNFDKNNGPCNDYVLPTQKEVASIYKKLNGDGQATINWFLDQSGYKYGVKQKVESILTNHEYTKDGIQSSKLLAKF